MDIPMKSRLALMTDKDLNLLPDLIKKEKEKRVNERTDQLSHKVIIRLQKELKKISEIIHSDFPDVHIKKVKLPVNVSYHIYNGIVNCETEVLEEDTNFDNAGEETQESRSVKAKINRIQKKFSKVDNEVKSLAICYNISEGDIWSIIDPDDNF